MDDNVPERVELFAELGEHQRRVAELQRTLGLLPAPPPESTRKLPPWVFELVDGYGSDFISIHAANGDYEYASPSSERLFGWTPEELLGQNAYGFFHSEDLKRIAADHSGHSEGGDQKVRYRLRCKNDEFRWVETRSRARVTEGGIQQIVCITRDVHDEELAKQASRAATLMLAEQQRAAVAGGLVAAFNHEFNNPLLAASLALQQLEEHPDGLVQHLADARTSLNRMIDVVREMSSIVYRDWSAQGRADLAAAVREVVALLPAEASANLVTASEPTWVPGPEAIVLQCLYHVAYSHVAGIPKGQVNLELDLRLTVDDDFVVLDARSACNRLPSVMRADLAGVVDGRSEGPELPMGLAQRLAKRLGGHLENSLVGGGLTSRLALPRVA